MAAISSRPNSAGAGGRTKRCIAAFGAAEGGGQGSHDEPRSGRRRWSLRPAGMGWNYGPGTCSSSCDNPPLSGDLVCKRPLHFQSGAKLGLTRAIFAPKSLRGATKLGQMLSWT